VRRGATGAAARYDGRVAFLRRWWFYLVGGLVVGYVGLAPG